MAASELIKRTVNRLLDYIEVNGTIPMVLPPERLVSANVGVSRTTLMKAFGDLQEKGILRQDNHAMLVLRSPERTDYYGDSGVILSKTESVENYILDQFSSNRLKPGDRFSELQIAKEIDANTVTVREVLLKISRTGLIAKKPRQKWEVMQISSDAITEINEYRELMEAHGLKKLLHDKAAFQKLHKERYEDLLNRHKALRAQKRIKKEKIDELENQFHMGIIEHSKNRFINDNYESLFFIIRFHLGQHNMTERRFRAVLNEHIAILEHIINGDFKNAAASLRAHFEESRKFFFIANNWPLT